MIKSPLSPSISPDQRIKAYEFDGLKQVARNGRIFSQAFHQIYIRLEIILRCSYNLSQASDIYWLTDGSAVNVSIVNALDLKFHQFISTRQHSEKVTVIGIA
ncbi:hypothetical protein EBO15_39805 [Actinomadura harenae]|uniref:Uncharacterized protein n=1 Tax=Actinomadura harenae TaxID=2483351 RepID=A0A3M2LG16_9ACTN|nr:hypothetical protein EBO15_39805 [Actinomadura harenae]